MTRIIYYAWPHFNKYVRSQVVNACSYLSRIVFLFSILTNYINVCDDYAYNHAMPMWYQPLLFLCVLLLYSDGWEFLVHLKANSSRTHNRIRSRPGNIRPIS
ncbi:hypothetical protein GDO81_007566 [Engystomops pustulosus]|uniref:Uncharacterized protein n=1 Tax=Engystomops pustulosus TaxID=76066 RepID=A0AAV7C7Z5_ENGPU|nr:hypothetical protein GDO81_007566 [Engystomops pustulosus]